MPKLKNYTMEFADRWFGMTDEQKDIARYPKTREELAVKLDVPIETIKKLEERWGTRQVFGSDYAKEYDSDTWLKSRTQQADKDLMQACGRGNPQALKLFNQLINRLVEKQETKVEIGLSAAEHIRIAREADRRISELNRGTNGDTGILEECPLLPLKVCVDRE